MKAIDRIIHWLTVPVPVKREPESPVEEPQPPTYSSIYEALVAQLDFRPLPEEVAENPGFWWLPNAGTRREA